MAKEEDGSRKRRLAQLRGKAAHGSNADRFDRLVMEALMEIPEPFRSRLTDVAILSEEEPSTELVRSLGIEPPETLLGLYDGIPLTQRGDSYNLVPPDRIILFRRPIFAMAKTPKDVREQVRRTVLHEVAHFYGIGDEELRRMGLD